MILMDHGGFFLTKKIVLIVFFLWKNWDNDFWKDKTEIINGMQSGMLN